MCMCVQRHGSPTTASPTVKQLHCWIPLMSFGLRIRTTDAFGDVGFCSQRSWSAVGVDDEMAPKNNTNEKFSDSRTLVFMQLTPCYDGQEV